MLYICIVLMYQHKGVSPEPFEQRPLSRIPGLGIRSPRRGKGSWKTSFFYFRCPHNFANLASKLTDSAKSLSISIRREPFNSQQKNIGFVCHKFLCNGKILRHFARKKNVIVLANVQAIYGIFGCWVSWFCARKCFKINEWNCNVGICLWNSSRMYKRLTCEIHSPILQRIPDFFRMFKYLVFYKSDKNWFCKRIRYRRICILFDQIWWIRKNFLYSHR